MRSTVRTLGASLPGITIVIPTLNEAEVLPGLIHDLDHVLANNSHLNVTELIFVDDCSTDGTIDIIENLKKNARPYAVHLLQRNRKLGSGSAEIEGAQNASNELVLKMDGDGQHPPRTIPTLAEAITDDIDIVIASRYVPGGQNKWPAVRGLISRIATSAAHALLPTSKKISDPLSGFYIVRRRLTTRLDPRITHYKAVLHIVACNPSVRVIEVPFIMFERKAGRSKIVGVSMDYVINFTIELLAYAKFTSKSEVSPLLVERLSPALDEPK